MTTKLHKARVIASAVAAGTALALTTPVVAMAAPGTDNGHHHCGGNSGQGQGNECDDTTDDGTTDDSGTTDDTTDTDGTTDDGTTDDSGTTDDTTDTDSEPPADTHTDVINIGHDIDLEVVVAPSVNVHFGDNITVENTTITEVTNVTTNNVEITENNDTYVYEEITIYSQETNRYFVGYWDNNHEFHCTGYYPVSVTTVEEAQEAQTTGQVVKRVPDVEVVTGVNPTASESSSDLLKWGIGAGVAVVVIAGVTYYVITRRRSDGDNGPTSIPGAGA